MSRAGQYIQQVKGYKAFIPKPLPPMPPLKPNDEYNYLLSKANLALGKLSGLASVISDPDLFVYLYVRKEALLSSQIEGTQCSLEDILSLDIQDENNKFDDIEEVSNYVRAMNEGLSKLNELPLCTRLIKKIHSTLMTGVRGSKKSPGEFRTSQNWIGRPDANLNTAEFVPPPYEEVDQHMNDLEKFIHAEDQIPHLVKAALIHSQFETIHPFLDGNGRLGRLLITYLLCFWKILDRPLLYLSYYFKAYRSEYYTKLMNVRLNGDWENWVKFFLKAVSESADMANIAALEIHKLHQNDKEILQKNNFTNYTHQVFNEFCRDPILNSQVLIERHQSTKPKVSRALKNLIDLGIIKEVSGKQRNRKYAYESYLQILIRDTNTNIG